MNPEPITAPKLLLQSAPGTALWEWTTLVSPTLIPVAQDHHISNTIPQFLAKVHPCDRAYLAEEVAPIGMTAGIIPHSSRRVAAVYVLWGFSPQPHGVQYVYEAWINHHSIHHTSPLKVLGQLQHLHFAFFDRSTKAERIYKIANALNWKLLIETVESFPAWNMADFDQVRECCPYDSWQLWRISHR